MAEGDDLYLENLEEVVNDENKIITYKGLSSLLNVPTNRAKEMLSTFVDQQSSKGNHLNVTFLLGGMSLDKVKSYKFLLVLRDHLEAMKSKFSHVSCCHIYSVQKSTLKNFEILHGADIDMTKTSLFNLNTWSSIYCPEAKQSDAALRRKHSLQEPQLEINGFDTQPSANLMNSDASSQQKLSSRSSTSKSSLNAKQVSSASFFGNSSKQKKGRQADQVASNVSSTNDKSSSNQKTEKEPIATKGEEKTGISFFGKSIEGKRHSGDNKGKEDYKGKEDDERKKEIRPKRKGDDEKMKEIRSKEEEQEKLKKERKPKIMETDGKDFLVKEGVDGKEDGENVSKSSKKIKRKKNQKEECSVKRRKTDLQESESEEDDDFESFIKLTKEKESHIKPNEMKTGEAVNRKVSKKETSRDSEDSFEILETNKSEKHAKESKERRNLSKTKTNRASEKVKDEKKKREDDLKTTEAEEVQLVLDQETPREKRRIRRKVLKSKTFMNEEGYMVTEKVYESESASEESDSEDKKKEPSKLNDIVRMKPNELSRENRKIKAEASKNKTQSSLMTFFKKK